MAAERLQLVERDALLETALAEVERADQRPMHDQVGIAPDRRGEMGVVAEIEPEMADVARRVGCLALGAQHQLRDDRRQLVLLELLEQTRQVGGTAERARAAPHAQAPESGRITVASMGAVIRSASPSAAACTCS